MVHFYDNSSKQKDVTGARAGTTFEVRRAHCVIGDVVELSDMLVLCWTAMKEAILCNKKSGSRF